jgi:hypothetical protein
MQTGAGIRESLMFSAGLGYELNHLLGCGRSYNDDIPVLQLSHSAIPPLPDCLSFHKRAASAIAVNEKKSAAVPLDLEMLAGNVEQSFSISQVEVVVRTGVRPSPRIGEQCIRWNTAFAPDAEWVIPNLKEGRTEAGLCLGCQCLQECGIFRHESLL